MMAGCLAGAIFILIAGVTLLTDKQSAKAELEIGKFFTGSGGLAALVLGVMMLRGAS